VIGKRVQIHYRRFPNKVQVFDQAVVLERDDVIITLSQPLELPEPLVAGRRVMLEQGSLALWFTFPEQWHDIGLFHLADRTYTGLYANILTPPDMKGDVWRTTDLFLDLWWPKGGDLEVLDEDELLAAYKKGIVDDRIVWYARSEVDRLLDLADKGAWPPPVVREWTLERALAELASLD
jgi:predicted RNA-binding protein associated with RNAse of E/G family